MLNYVVYEEVIIPKVLLTFSYFMNMKYYKYDIEIVNS